MENITSIVFVITRDGFWFAEKFLHKTNIQRILKQSWTIWSQIVWAKKNKINWCEFDFFFDNYLEESSALNFLLNGPN